MELIPLMEKYFSEEKSESLVFLSFGVLSMFFGAYALLKGGVLMKGMAYPVLIVGLIQLVVGGTIFFRTDRQVADLKTQLQTQAPVFKSEETQRMEKVISSFRLYKMIEIGLALVGIVLIIGHSRMGLSDTMAGIGAGLLLQSTLMLVADLFAEDRAGWYFEALQKFTAAG